MLYSDDHEVKFDDCHTISFDVVLSDATIFKYLASKLFVDFVFADSSLDESVVKANAQASISS